MALMVLMASWAAARGVVLAAVSVDHGLRPEAAGEAALAGRVAAGLGLTHEVLIWRDWDGRGNVQDAARQARRRLIADWARGQGIDTVALAHTGDDQAETLLMRLARGSGVDGLSAMAARREAAGLTWIRPLLGESRAALRDLLVARGLKWAEDPSNEDVRFERVKARRVLASLEPLGISRRGLVETAGRMARARAALEDATREAALKGATITAAGDVVIGRAVLDALPVEISLRLMAHALCWVGGAAYRPRLAALERLLANAAVGEAGTLHGCMLRSEAGAYRITREAQALRGVTATLGDIWDGRWCVSGPPDSALHVAALGEAGLAGCPDWRATGLARDSLLASPAVWRGADLVAAPIAGRGEGWSAKIAGGSASFYASILSH